MPGPLLLIANTAVKLVAGFALGFLARDVTRKHQNNDKGKQSAGKASVRKVGVAKAVNLVPREELKMVLCVNEALKMGKGKIGAQCAHAALGVFQRHRGRNELLFKQWEYNGQAKIALKIQDDVEMDELAAKALSLGMPTYIVCDAGRTQIPAGSQTVLAIGPAPKTLIDQVTGHLRLL